MVTRGIDPAELLAFEHDIDYSPLVADPRLSKVLAALPGRKLVMTNSIGDHAEIVLERLGISVDGVLICWRRTSFPSLFPRPTNGLLPNFTSNRAAP